MLTAIESTADPGKALEEARKGKRAAGSDGVHANVGTQSRAEDGASAEEAILTDGDLRRWADIVRPFSGLAKDVGSLLERRRQLAIEESNEQAIAAGLTPTKGKAARGAMTTPSGDTRGTGPGPLESAMMGGYGPYATGPGLGVPWHRRWGFGSHGGWDRRFD